MVNNFNTLSCLFDKLQEGDFYFVQIIQGSDNSNYLYSGNALIKSYIFNSKEQFFNSKDSIINICNLLKATAYFWINPRDYKTCQLSLIRQTSYALQYDLDKLLQLPIQAIRDEKSIKYNNLYILNFNKKDDNVIKQYLNIINNICVYQNFEYFCIPTIKGSHVIVSGFDIKLFNQECIIAKLPNVEVFVNNPTILYTNN